MLDIKLGNIFEEISIAEIIRAYIKGHLIDDVVLIQGVIPVKASLEVRSKKECFLESGHRHLWVVPEVIVQPR